MNSNHGHQPSHWKRGYENFNEALHEAHHERAFTLLPADEFPTFTRLSTKTKFFFTIAAAILLSAPAWAGESSGEQPAIAVTTTAAAGAGCGAAALLMDVGSHGTAKPSTMLKSCAAGALIAGGMTNVALEAQSEDAWEQSVLENYDSEK